MKKSLDSKSNLQEYIYQKWKNFSRKAEAQVMIILLSLIAIGVMYNIVSHHLDKQPNFNICPLCEEPTHHVIYEQRNPRYTF